MVKKIDTTEENKARMQEQERFARIIQESLGETYSVGTHPSSIPAAIKNMGFPIHIQPSRSYISVTDERVFDDAYKVAERLEREANSKEYTLKVDFS